MLLKPIAAVLAERYYLHKNPDRFHRMFQDEQDKSKYYIQSYIHRYCEP